MSDDSNAALTEFSLHLTDEQVSAVTRLIMARLGHHRREIHDNSRVTERRQRIRILGEFMNSINRLPETDAETGFPVRTCAGTEEELELLNEELTLMYAVVRPDDVPNVIDADVEETALTLSGWAHRAGNHHRIRSVF